MKEADIQRELRRALRYIGLWDIHLRDASICPRCHTKVLPTADRPDILALNPRGVSVVIEVKAFKGTSFPFSAITEGQRTWLTNWALDGGKGYLALGTLERAPARKLWLIPWSEWIEIEALLRPIQASLPLENPRRIEAREKELDAVTLLGHYSALWVGGDQKWELPLTFPRHLYHRDPSEFSDTWNRTKSLIEGDWDTFYKYWRLNYESN